MSLLCRAKTILKPATTSARLPLRTMTLFASAGLLIGFGSTVDGSTADAAATPAVVTIQEQDEQKDHDVEIHEVKSDSKAPDSKVVVKVETLQDGDSKKRKIVKKLSSDSLGQLHEIVADADGKVQVIVTQDGDTKGHQEMLDKLKLHLKGQLHEIVPDSVTNREVIVLGEGDSDLQGLLKKLKLKHKGQLHKLHSDADENVEVIVLGEGESDHQGLLKILKSKHKGQLHKLHSDSDDNHNIFVFDDDTQEDDGTQEGDVIANLHSHLGEVLLGQESGKLNHAALAKALRQLADRLEAKHNKPHSVRESKGNIKLHSHDGDHKKIILHGDEHGTDLDIVLEEVHLDGEISQIDLAKKILGRIKKTIPKHKVVIDEIHQDGEDKTHVHESSALDVETFRQGLDASIRDLRNELEELRKELKDLQSDRPTRKNRRKK